MNLGLASTPLVISKQYRGHYYLIVFFTVQPLHFELRIIQNLGTAQIKSLWNSKMYL